MLIESQNFLRFANPIHPANFGRKLLMLISTILYDQIDANVDIFFNKFFGFFSFYLFSSFLYLFSLPTVGEDRQPPLVQH